jgi:hypothetical protein
MKNKEIIIGSQGGGLGDNLQITPLFKYFTNATLEIINNDYGKDLSAVYETIANKIEFKEKPIRQEVFFSKYGNPERSEPLRNGALNYLTIFGIENEVSPIPKINLNQEELKKTEEKLAKYKNPIALVTYGGGYKKHDVLQQYPEYRLLEKNKWQFIVNELSKTYSVIHFFKGDNLMQLENCIEINNLSIYELKHYFAIIKKYLGIDTGSYHLMLAVNGFAHVIVPDLSWQHQYCPSNWQYEERLWEKEEYMRVKYYNKNREWQNVLNYL